MGTLNHIDHIDNQFLVGLDNNGLGTITPDKSQTWRDDNWRHWPGVLGATDQGPTCVSAHHALVYKPEIMANHLAVWDWSHGAQNDLNLEYEQQHQMPLVILSLVVVNLRSGPDKEPGMRHEQITQVLDHMFAKFTPRTCRLFLARHPALAKEMKDVVEPEPGEESIDAVWRHMKDETQEVKGTRTKMCQFMGWISSMHEFLSMWNRERYKREWLALEYDYLPLAALKKEVPVGKKMVEHAKEVKTTSSSATHADTKVLRATSVNNIVLSVKFQEDEKHLRILSILVLVPWPLRLWQGHAATNMKSVKENLAWLIEQIASDFLGHQHAMMDALKDVDTMERCMFVKGAEVDPDNCEAEIASEDAFAGLAGNLALGLVSKRERRLLYMTSCWPNESTKVLLSSEVAERVRVKFQRQKDTYAFVAALPAPGEVVRDMLRRSPFPTTPCRQLSAAFRSPKDLSDAISLVEERWSGILSSNCIEDWNGLQKNNGQMRGSQRRRRPPRAMAVGLSRRWLETKHRYRMLRRATRSIGKTRRLKPEAFGQTPHKFSIDVRGVSSTRAKTTWWSPLAEDLGIPAADAAVLEEAKTVKRSADVEHAACAAFCKYDHLVAWHRPETPECTEVKWCVGLTPFKHSGALVKPLRWVEVPGTPGSWYAEVDTAVTEVVLTAVLDWKHITCYQMRWRSWAWQKRHFPNAEGRWSPAVRMFPVRQGAEMSLHPVACYAAFWSIAVEFLIIIAVVLGCPLPKDVTLFTVLLALIMHGLKCSREKALEIMAERLKWVAKPTDTVVDIVKECDEAADCLAPEDEKKLRDAKKRIDCGDDWRDDVFATDYFDAKAADHKARGKGGKGKGKAAPKTKLDQDRLAMMEQKDAKKFMPPGPGVYLWQTRASSSWNSQVCGLGEHSRTTRKPNALFWVICRAWQDWAFLQGIPEDEIPVEGYEPDDTD